MKLIIGGPGSGKTKKLMEIALDYLNEGKPVHIISCKNSPEEIIHRLRLESAKIGMSYSPHWSNKLTVSRANSIGDLSKEVIDAQSDIILIDKPTIYRGMMEDLELLRAISSQINPMVYVTQNAKNELREGILIVDDSQLTEVQPLF